MKNVISALVCAAVLSACGGGGGGSEPAPILAKGVYLAPHPAGLFDQSQRPYFQIVLEDGESWIYDAVAPEFFATGRFAFKDRVSIASQTSVPRFESTSAVVFVSRQTVQNNTLSFTQRIPSSDANALFSDVIHPSAYPAGRRWAKPGDTGDVFNLNFGPERIDYDTPASLAAVAGPWFAPYGICVPKVSDVNILPDGSFTGKDAKSACNVQGTIRPSASGKNYYTVTMALSNCSIAGQYSGVGAVYRDYTGVAAVPYLLLMGLDTNKTQYAAITVLRAHTLPPNGACSP